MPEEIEKTEAPKLVFETEAGEYLVLKGESERRVMEALSNPIRREIYDTLNEGPLQQSALAQRTSKRLGRGLSDALLRHHLKYLEQAGLTGSKVNTDVSGNPKIVYRKSDVQVQLAPREVPVSLTGVPPRTREEFVEELKRTFGKSSGSSKKSKSKKKGGKG